jgi:hypothetical protein
MGSEIGAGKTEDGKQVTHFALLAAEHLEIFRHRLAALRPRHNMISLFFRNNYLKQLAFGARANSPVSIFPHYPKAVISKLKATQKQKERGRVSPRPS